MLNVTDIGINHRNLNVVKIKNKYNLVVQRQKTYKMSKNHNDRTTSCTSVRWTLKGPAYPSNEGSPIMMILGYFVDLLTLKNKTTFFFNYMQKLMP